MQKRKNNSVAAVDVGSNTLRMVIAQITCDGEILPIEDLWKPTHIGRDTFAYGKIQAESIHETCETLKGFAKVMEDYKIRHYRAVATSGIREAENRGYVLEQIRLRTGLVVEVINNAQERFLMYKAVRDHMNDAQKFRDKGTLIVDIGSGGVEVSVYGKGSLKFTEYVKVGSLRLREILADLERRTLDFPSIMEEFVKSRIDFLEDPLQKSNIRNFIGLGGELRTISNLCMEKDSANDDKLIKKSTLAKLYSKVHKMTTEQIINEYGLARNQAEILLPSVIIFYRFLQMTDAEGIYAPMVSLRHGILADIADEWFDTSRKKESINDIISSIWNIGQKYAVDINHCSIIEKLALTIFDQTVKLHRLGDKERFYLRIAAILHDIGKYINLNEHDIHSYNIIRSLDIMGFSNKDLSLVANITRYHSEEVPSMSHENYMLLNDNDRMVVSKLAAILKIAESLDISHKQKIKEVDINIVQKELHIIVRTTEDILLEEWNFANSAVFFEEVMGSKPVIKLRR